MFGLTYIRKISGITAEELANILGIERAAVAAWERKKSIPSKRLKSLSELFDGLDKEYFSKELTEFDKFEIQHFRTFNFLKNNCSANEFEEKKEKLETFINFKELVTSNNKFTKKVLNQCISALKHYKNGTLPNNTFEIDLCRIICKYSLKEEE